MTHVQKWTTAEGNNTSDDGRILSDEHETGKLVHDLLGTSVVEDLIDRNVVDEDHGDR